MPAFVKTQVGQKRFVIEWDLTATSAEVAGDPFECVDAEPLSISVDLQPMGGAAPILSLMASNHQGAPNWTNYAMQLQNAVPIIVPNVRWVFPHLSSLFGSSMAKVAILFREVG